MITLTPFWEMLRKRGISTYDLEYRFELNPAEISRLKHNHNFTLRSLDKYCFLFHCGIEDILLYQEDGRRPPI